MISSGRLLAIVDRLIHRCAVVKTLVLYRSAALAPLRPCNRLLLKVRLPLCHRPTFEADKLNPCWSGLRPRS